MTTNSISGRDLHTCIILFTAELAQTGIFINEGEDDEDDDEDDVAPVAAKALRRPLVLTLEQAKVIHDRAAGVPLPTNAAGVPTLTCSPCDQPCTRW